MAKVLVISFSQLARDPRVTRQVSELANRHELTVAGFGVIGVPIYRSIDLKYVPKSTSEKVVTATRMMAMSFEAMDWNLPHANQLRRQTQGEHFDLVVANDVEALPSAFSIARDRIPVVLDAHEYAADEVPITNFASKLHRRHRIWLCEEYIPKVAGMMTVSEPIAHEYERVFGVVRPIVVPNAAPYQQHKPKRVDPNRIRLIYHGIVNPARGVDLMIQAMQTLPSNYELTLMLVAHESELRKLEEESAKLRNVSIIRPVDTQSISAFVNDYDVGVYAMQPQTFNERSALPNKFFENVQARVAQVVTPTSEMPRYVREHGLGVIARDYDAEAFAEALLSLDADTIFDFKVSADESARTLSWERYSPKINEMIDGLI